MIEQKIQMCSHCDQPTERCEDDSLFSQLLDEEPIGPLCEECFDMFEKERMNLLKAELL